MAIKLVILESPAKAGTVGRILGKDYTVVASKGHIRDLPESMLGVQIDKDFEPVYVNIRKQTSIINELRELAREAETVYLASDPDREGEAIAWHLAYILSVTNAPVYRVTFNEITEKGIRAGMEHPRKIDLDLVDSYQARRVLDRLVGYQISPVLWKKIKKNLSAGRVQSVATRLICDREEEIENFVPKEYWTVTALNETKTPEKETFKASYYGRGGKKEELKNGSAAEEVVKAIEKQEMTVTDVKRTDKKVGPYAPFTTSTLQQDSSHKLGFNPGKTMQIAQQLYEGVNIAGVGFTGLVTYIRTDSVRIADDAATDARNYIRNKFGNDYLPPKKRVFKTKGSAQDAHEAIRPTHIDFAPDDVKSSLTGDQYKLYKLIFDRFIASQMSDMVYGQTSVTLECNGYTFKSSGSVVKFKGFSAQYKEDPAAVAAKDGSEENAKLPRLEAGDTVSVKKVESQQHFTQPPARFTEAALVKALEELGIGRPSTYATIISTIEAREYVKNEKKQLVPTEMGKVVNELMKKSFPEIVDVGFTAGIESKLDEIAAGEIAWKQVIREFYGPFSKELQEAESIERVVIKPQESDQVCDICGRPLVYRKSRFGEFLGCSGYPECKFIKSIQKEVTGRTCPECGRQLVYKKSAKGRQFISCSGYPECKFSSSYEPTGKMCPQCGKYLVYKRGRGNKKYIACSNPACDYMPSAAAKKAKAEAAAGAEPEEK